MDQGEKEEARAAFRHGADAGNISCMYWLGKMMLQGQGGAVEAKQGIEWLEAAAAQGHFFAKRKLLAVEQREAGSILRKLLILGRIIALAAQVAKESWKDADSDKLR